MKKAISILVIIVIIVVAFALISNKQQAGGDSIKIGAIYTLTGPLASFGEFQKRSAEFAVKQTNDVGGIDSKPVELYIEDSASDAKKGVDAYNALKLRGVKFYLVEYSPVAAAVRPLAVADGNFLMTAGATTPAYADGSSLTCRTTMTAKEISSALVARLAKKNMKNVSFLLPNNEYGKGLADEFTKNLTSQGGRIVAGEFYDASGPADFRTNMTKIKARMNDADALIATNPANSVEPFLEQIINAGWTKPVLSDYNTLQNPSLKNKALANNVEFVDWSYQTLADPTDSPVTKAFKEKYKAQFGQDPSLAAAGYYDGVQLIIDGLKIGGKTPEKVSEYIRNLKDYDVVTGKIISFDQDCQAARATIFRKMVNGELIKAD